MSRLVAPLPSGVRSLRRRTHGFLVLHRRWLAAAAVGLAVLTGLRVVSPPPPPSTQVVVAAHDLPGGRALTEDDLAVRQVPQEAAPAGSAATVAGVTGELLAAPVRAGEAITDRRVLAAALLDAHPGAVAVPVRLPDAGVRDLLGVGDRVDLVASSRQGTASVVADAVPVLALPRAAVDSQTPAGSGVLVVLAVPEPDALDVVRASAAGVIGVVLLG